MSFLTVLQQGDRLRKSCLEAAAVAVDLAAAADADLDAVYIGSGLEQTLDLLAGSGIRKVFLYDEPHLNNASEGQLAVIIESLARNMDHSVIVGSATTFGKELFASLSARLDTELVQDCIGASWEKGLVVTKALYGGRVHAQIRFTGNPALISCRPNVFPIKSSNGDLPEIVRMAAHIESNGIRFVEAEKPSADKLVLTEANIVVSGGRGMDGNGSWEILEQLCDEIGGALGASRAAVDSGWIPHSHQVGQTGKIVNPDLYIACGISGAVQHFAGMRESRIVVAINRDPNAPIFEMCDYGIVGDLFEVVPVLVEELRQRRS
jgi:electron transfer flavoprotein alpha subunit